jgi:Fe-Mn family superoxide dismutase
MSSLSIFIKRKKNVKLNKKYAFSLLVFLLVCIVSTVSPIRQKQPSTEEELPTPPPHYQVKKFALQIKGLSNNQIEQHKTLYAGYVKKRNQIEENLQTVSRADSKNRTYSPFRALKVAQTYAHNGAVLHELYFENLGKQNATVGPLMQQFINKNFGSLQAFQQDLLDCANCARGWAVTCYCIDDGSIKNFVLEEHNTHVPMLVIPLLVLDVYEHAYMIDFGINRDPYLDIFWNNINWDVVEERIAQWVKPLQEKSKTEVME